MFSLKIKKSYLPPAARTAQADLEGLICLSAYKAVYVDESHNINSDTKTVDGVTTTVEPLYFEF